MSRFLDNLWLSIATLKNKEEIRFFFQELLTPTEAQMLAKRLVIAVLLEEGRSYQCIKDTLHVQNSTIAKISNILNTSPNGHFKKTAQNLGKKGQEKRKKEKKDTRPGKEPPPRKPHYTFGSL